MFFQSPNNGQGVFKSVLMAYFILVLHVLLIAGLGILVLFFRGIVHYMIWIFLFGSAALAASAWLFYKRMKQEGRTLRDMLRSPMFNGRSVEVSLLGGLASFRVGAPSGLPAIEDRTPDVSRQLEDPEAVRLRELKELVRMLEKNLITLDEYEKAKQQIFR